VSKKKKRKEKKRKEKKRKEKKRKEKKRKEKKSWLLFQAFLVLFCYKGVTLAVTGC
jgi:cell division septal protein FtsQ